MSINSIVIFHVGNINIFYKILNDYSSFFSKEDKIYFVTTHSLKNKEIIENKLPNSVITIIPNKGMDIYGKLICIKQILNYENYNSVNNFYFIHTKTDDCWRNQLLSPLLNNSKILNNLNFIDSCESSKINYKPIIVGSYDYTFFNNKSINRKYIVDILNRNFDDIISNEITKYFDEYIFDINEKHDKNIFIFNSNFYKNYEVDLKKLNNDELLNHYNKYGINEYHRITNPCYIKKKAQKSFFIAGSIFYSNRSFIDIFKNIDLEHEAFLLEEGYIVNDIPRKTHAWEYIFGLFCYIYNSNVYSIKNDGKIINPMNKPQEKFNIQSIININPLESRVAFFLLIPNESSIYSGGYKTLINYIKVLEENNIYVDLYFGDSTNDMNTTKIGLSILDSNIYDLVSYIEKFNLLDIKKHNYFLGLNVQRNYDIIVANAWQISQSVYLNYSKAKQLAYIIQDEETLFYPNQPSLQQIVTNTYKKEYKYYCLSNYLYNSFKNNGFNCYGSILGPNLNIYKNMNYNRSKTLVIAYYTWKIGRLPNLVEELIEKISKKYICYVFPSNYTKTKNCNIINVGEKTIYELNEMYNNSTVGIVLSNTNPSRLGYEMLASGLKVIEYDSKFTQYDMPNNYFNKIKNSNNIINLVDNLMYNNYVYPEDYLKDNSNEIENKKCLNFFEKLLDNTIENSELDNNKNNVFNNILNIQNLKYNKNNESIYITYPIKNNKLFIPKAVNFNNFIFSNNITQKKIQTTQFPVTQKTKIKLNKQTLLQNQGFFIKKS